MRESLSKVHEIEKNFCVLLLSLPTQGGWIEINIERCHWDERPGPSPHREGGLKSLREAGIGINSGPSPHREGGLKSIVINEVLNTAQVPPHTGRVD